ncbi:MAG: hypothetical protein A3G59_00925 [Candidatus Taylorbacteria bacterium RIFCSPLOWO2_12_FULL_47_20]|uniref:alanine--tRNA ligase n=2 Tax=Candidatus Tayloriibacteriota TaxID=1817919 RepID=A0A1G2PBJ2_9BACT|nr:MAG: hypothetical protein A3H68_00960 [Candidatus Taylorbacteria bacterium RIFCSPLOWO2_02_FULL_46_40]OHA45653.1 MAG: hypothetical protein A3G59_00925 [Candidatus Taylorbacteria bacterium RIFCSPLOWO2_12_FULL_47_20]
MDLYQLRNRYLKFFESKGHTILPSAPLAPENDPTTLFTGSGMQPLVSYFLGQKHPLGTRLVNSQKCFRAEDLEEVGDNRHTTFFEMLGNWSLGDYFKKEQLPWIFEFLTDIIGLPAERLHVTVFGGDEKNGLPKDDEAAMIWKELFAKKRIDAKDVDIGSPENGSKTGTRGGRIFYYDSSKNWWSRSGRPEKMPAGEPGGPDSEIFFDFGPSTSSGQARHDLVFGKECHPNCNCGRFIEIGNSVFMQYKKNENGGFDLLPQKNVDFGGGLERISAAAKGNPDVFNTDGLNAVIQVLGKYSGKNYADVEGQDLRRMRVAADHVRAAVFMAGDQILPSNKERGYVMRRLIRRAVFMVDRLGVTDPAWIGEAVVSLCKNYGDFYGGLDNDAEGISRIISGEAEHFRKSLADGLRYFEKNAARDQINAETLFELFATHGIPVEMLYDLIAERGIDADKKAFERKIDEHRKQSRGATQEKFKGGLADTSAETTRLHTAHHLLLRALQMTLGDHVKQRGSNITAQRLRIDFSHGEKMTADQIARVEKIVNEKIAECLPMIKSVMGKEEAMKLNAESEFGKTYPDTVSVYSIGPSGATQDDPRLDKAFSMEFCGGPHAANTRELGKFKILKEESVAAGVRRIKATLG